MSNYDDCIAAKLKTVKPSGFKSDASTYAPGLFAWQSRLVHWALLRGRAALFEECGLGKTIQQLEWARQVCDETGKPVLILCPLAVAAQTVAEGNKFGILVRHIREPEEIDGSGIYCTNYERVEKFASVVERLGGAVLDESSILKSFTGKTRGLLTELFRNTQFKLCCTATPAPNDFTELGQHADFLNVCSPSEMLATYFINDAGDTGTWKLKGHAEDAFWRWVASWAACVSKPSDLGASDDGFVLPDVRQEIIKVEVNHAAASGSEELFRNPNASAAGLFAERRISLDERCQAAAAIVNESNQVFVVWCETNDESDLLHRLIPDSVEVKGSDDVEDKELRLAAFCFGSARVLVTKPKIAGFGLNFQHCHNEIFVSLTHSYERFYQAGKRLHRFGQKHQIHRRIIKTDLDDGVMRNIATKALKHDTIRQLVQFTADNIKKPTEKPRMKMNDRIESAHGDGWVLHLGDCVRVAAQEMEEDSIDFAIFSPPFADLFTYSDDIQDMGNCRNVDEFMIQFGFLVDELKRVMVPGREVCVHCCDLMATKWKDGAIELKDFSGQIATAFRARGFMFHSRITIWKDPVVEMQRTKAHGLLYKTLQKDSSNSRVGAADYLLAFRKPGVNPKPIAHRPEQFSLARWQEIASPVWMTVDQGNVLNGRGATDERDERHICPLQLDVIERAMALWSNRGDLVFSPFAGIGSEGYCALKHGRRFVGAELKQSYWEAAQAHLREAAASREDLFALAGVSA